LATRNQLAKVPRIKVLPSDVAQIPTPLMSNVGHSGEISSCITYFKFLWWAKTGNITTLEQFIAQQNSPRPRLKVIDLELDNSHLKRFYVATEKKKQGNKHQEDERFANLVLDLTFTKWKSVIHFCICWGVKNKCQQSCS
jgi:hypothetical protein